MADAARGITEIVNGTGGAGFYSLGTTQPNSKYFTVAKHGILKVTLKPTGWDSVLVPNDGTANIDPSSGSCH